jgi:CHAT domain-containing protein
VSRTVIKIYVDQVGAAGGDTSFRILLAEPNVKGAQQLAPFLYSPRDPVPEGFRNRLGGVDEIGEYIWNGLCNHEAVKQHMTTLLGLRQGTTESVLLCISPEAEGLAWEALCADGSFLALDRRWSIGRMSLGAPPHGRPRNFQPPLKILAVLAADEVEAGGEWKSLLDSLSAASFPVTVKALVAEKSLYEEIEETRSNMVSVEVDYVPGDPGVFVRMIEDFSPNILHFFCHGSESGGTSYLRVATVASRAGDLAGTHILEATDLPAAGLGDDLWLVTLNCCGSAEPTEAAGSIAFLLSSTGVPVVAGMRESVAAEDANAFSQGFYRAVVELLAPAASAGRSKEVDWPTALYEARIALCEAHRGEVPCREAAPSNREWTLPVLYVGGEQFTLRGRRRPRRPTAPEGANPARRALGGVVGRAKQPLAGPRLTDAERATREAQLQILRDLVDKDLGAPAEVLDAYRSRIRDLERELYGRK